MEMALGEKRATGIMLVIGDFNASTGTIAGPTDLVCGPHGNPHQDDPGRKLEATAAMLGVVDLTTWEEQRMVNTCYGIISRSGRQIDRAFVTIQDGQLMVKCVNAAMVVDSDHESARIKIVIEKTEKPLKTKRKGRQQKEAGNAFGREANPKIRTEAVAKVLQLHENSAARATTPRGEFDSLTCSDDNAGWCRRHGKRKGKQKGGATRTTGHWKLLWQHVHWPPENRSEEPAPKL
jgi:hypothetical protein